MRRKVISIFIVLCLLIMILLFCIYQYTQQGIKKSMDLVFNDSLNVEYGDEDITAIDLIKEIKNAEIKEYSEIDPYKIGNQEITYTLWNNGIEKTISCEIIVQDTAAPMISFKEDIVNINVGDTFDPLSNIESVKDPVDGDLNFNQEESSKNCYIVSGNVDASKEGTYEITVTAIDNNGVQTTSSFTVNVVMEHDNVISDGGSWNNSGQSNSNKKQHYVNAGALPIYRSNYTLTTSFIEQLQNGSNKLYYSGSETDAFNAWSEVWFKYLEDLTMTEGRFDYREDDAGTYILLTSETYNDALNALPKAHQKWSWYRQQILAISSSMNLYCSDYELAKQFHDYIANRFSYQVTDKSLWHFMENNIGQCYHYARLFQDLCLSVGIQCTYESGNNHAWNYAILDGVTYKIDVTWDDTSGTNSYSFIVIG